MQFEGARHNVRRSEKRICAFQNNQRLIRKHRPKSNNMYKNTFLFHLQQKKCELWLHEFIFICLSRTPSVQHLYERTILHSTCTRNPTKSTDFRILHKEVNIKKINLFFYHKNLTELNLEEVETNGKKQWRRKQPKKKSYRKIVCINVRRMCVHSHSDE